MPRPKKVKIKNEIKIKRGGWPRVEEPVRKAHDDTIQFVERVKKPPKALRRFPWPKI